MLNRLLNHHRHWLLTVVSEEELLHLVTQFLYEEKVQA